MIEVLDGRLLKFSKANFIRRLALDAFRNEICGLSMIARLLARWRLLNLR